MKRNEAIFESRKVIWTLVILVFWVRNVLRATTICIFSTSRPLKVVRRYDMLISKCTLYHNGMYFFDILISKSCLTLKYFIHFDLEMWFAPHRCALFRHLNFQKWSENSVFYIFYFGNVLRTTTAYIFSTF